MWQYILAGVSIFCLKYHLQCLSPKSPSGFFSPASQCHLIAVFFTSSILLKGIKPEGTSVCTFYNALGGMLWYTSESSLVQGTIHTFMAQFSCAICIYIHSELCGGVWEDMHCWCLRDGGWPKWPGAVSVLSWPARPMLMERWPKTNRTSTLICLWMIVVSFSACTHSNTQKDQLAWAAGGALTGTS